MYVDFKPLSANEVYFSMIQAVVPRPIAWVLSENSNGSHNLAPFSYFNAVCSKPPLIMLSIGVRPDGTLKDTTANIAARRDFNCR
jgi:flavin reductase (DIM6/NTAB) family NADH-FMN oxidoreductase RutF